MLNLKEELEIKVEHLLSVRKGSIEGYTISTEEGTYNSHQYVETLDSLVESIHILTENSSDLCVSANFVDEMLRLRCYVEIIRLTTNSDGELEIVDTCDENTLTESAATILGASQLAFATLNIDVTTGFCVDFELYDTADMPIDWECKEDDLGVRSIEDGTLIETSKFDDIVQATTYFNSFLEFKTYVLIENFPYFVADPRLWLEYKDVEGNELSFVLNMASTYIDEDDDYIDLDDEEGCE